MRKHIRISCICVAVMLTAVGCGGNTAQKDESEVPVIEDFDALLRDDRTQVIVRDEPVTVEQDIGEQEAETSTEAETEMVVPYADRIAGDSSIAYNIETAVYEEGVVRVEYPQLTSMADGARQQEINEKIRRAVIETVSTDNLSSYELKYETVTKGSGIVSFIFRGIENYANSAYPNNVVRTLNVDLNTGKNARLKDFADIAQVVSSLENASGYTIVNEGVDAADFSAYLNNGAVTDYAFTLLDYDIDFDNPEMVPAGFSAIRDNHLILFIKAEHAMGDYVELEFDKNL